ncbi:MAG: dephospho-CoA kinase, partial [Oscillospiraceae bacterium]|nr:dephospho-CoA kinase [Oscillospiraceae bacterium]
MIKIAVTGPSGSGKSTLIKILADKGYPVIDCDIIAHQLQNPG